MKRLPYLKKHKPLQSIEAIRYNMMYVMVTCMRHGFTTSSNKYVVSTIIPIHASHAKKGPTTAETHRNNKHHVASSTEYSGVYTPRILIDLTGSLSPRSNSRFIANVPSSSRVSASSYYFRPSFFHRATRNITEASGCDCTYQHSVCCHLTSFSHYYLFVQLKYLHSGAVPVSSQRLILTS